MSGHVSVVYNIGDALSFARFIMELRRKIVAHLDCGDIMDSYNDPNFSSTREHPLLATNPSVQQARWLHINLQVVVEEETSSATLFVQDDNLYCLGFMNQNGYCYELTNPEGWKLPSEYKAVPLDWGIAYESILKVTEEEEVEEVVKRLDAARLGKTFAMDAVRVLSRFAPAEVDGDETSAKLALAGLIVMVCESARLNPLRKAFTSGWNAGTRFTMELMEYMMRWELISVALLDWKDNSYEWNIHPELAEITGVRSPVDALDIIHLVRNFTKEQRQLLHKYIFES